MGDLKNPRWIYAKGWLFLLGGFMASALVVAENPTLKTVILLTVAIWCFCRFYYFAFYVIEHYVDPNFKFAGLFAFVRYQLRQRSRPATDRPKGP